MKNLQKKFSKSTDTISLNCKNFKTRDSDFKTKICFILFCISILFIQFSSLKAQVTYGSGVDRPAGGGPHIFPAGATTVDNIRAHTTGSGVHNPTAANPGVSYVNIINSVGTFKVGDMVLIIQMMTTGCTGSQNWEFQTVASIIGAQTGLTFAQPLIVGSDYTFGQVIKVPQYGDVTFTAGGYITCNPWDGNITNTNGGGTGGVIPLLANGTVTFNSNEVNVNADGKGFEYGTAGSGGIGGAGGAGGNNIHLDGYLRPILDTHSAGQGGEGIGGAGWGGDKGATVANNGGTNTTPLICCGCETPHAKNKSDGSVGIKRLLMGGSGNCGNGGKGGLGAGGSGFDAACSASPTSHPGQGYSLSTPLIGRGGDGGLGGRGGGVVLIHAKVISQPVSGTSISAKGNYGLDGLDGEQGGQGGVATTDLGAGGGNGGNGGNGGDGGNGGAGGWLHVLASNNSSLARPRLRDVTHGAGGQKGVGGTAGLAGVNADLSSIGCPCKIFCACPEVENRLLGAVTTGFVAGVANYTYTTYGGGTCKVTTLPGNLSIECTDATGTACTYYCDMIEAGGGLNDPSSCTPFTTLAIPASPNFFNYSGTCNKGTFSCGGVDNFISECCTPPPPCEYYCACSEVDARMQGATGGPGNYVYTYGSGGTCVVTTGIGSLSIKCTDNITGCIYHCDMFETIAAHNPSSCMPFTLSVVPVGPIFNYIGPCNNGSFSCAGIDNFISNCCTGFVPPRILPVSGEPGSDGQDGTPGDDGGDDGEDGPPCSITLPAGFTKVCGDNTYTDNSGKHNFPPLLNAGSGSSWQWTKDGIPLTPGNTQTQETVLTNTGPGGSPTGAGHYCVTIDGTCTACIDIVDPDPTPTISASGPTTLCSGGSVTLDAGIGYSSYEWNIGTPDYHDQSIVVTSSQNYCVTVADEYGCTGTACNNVTVASPVVASSSLSNVTCYAYNNGFATLTVSGGTPPYTYDWNTSPAQTTSTIIGLSAGTYTATITDAGGCTGSTSLAISEPAPIIIIDSIKDVACNGQSNGEIKITTSGGTPPYSYLWSNSANTQNVYYLSAGTYSVIVTDDNGCSASRNSIVSQPGPIIIIDSIISVACNGGNNGGIKITPSGGTLPYSYLWSNGAVTQNIYNLTAGAYSVNITDNNGCSASRNSIVSQPGPIIIIDSIISVACKNSNTGSINLSVSGGTPPYSYSWSNGNMTAHPTSLHAGTYTVLVVDANACQQIRTYTLNQANTALAANMSKVNVKCGGKPTGSINAIPTGGVPPYSYLWSNSAVSSSITNLFAGVYTCTITDAVGCVKTSIVSVTQNPILVVAVVPSGSTQATATVTGGIPPYTYYWSSNPPQTTSTAILLLPGSTYKVRVSDFKNCSKTSTVTIPIPRISNSLSADLNITAFPNPAQEYVTLQFENATTGTNYEITFSNMLGEKVLQTDFKPKITNGTRQVYIGKLSKGIYNLIIQSEATRKHIRLVIQ